MSNKSVCTSVCLIYLSSFIDNCQTVPVFNLIFRNFSQLLPREYNDGRYVCTYMYPIIRINPAMYVRTHELYLLLHFDFD